MLKQDILNEIVNQDYETITKKIEEFLINQVKSADADGLILGMSGGIDSAVLAYLAKRVLKEKTLALIMPDSDITPKTETEDALNMIDKIGIEYKLIDIKPIVNEYTKYLEPNDWAIGNLRARIRSNILYYYANAKNYLVLGSSDKSEYLIGYFTKYGDGASDLTPIISLYKIQVREISKHIGIPENIIQKKSSPHLWKDHEAEKEIGIMYEVVDAILYCIYDKKFSIDETVSKTEIPKETVEKIQRLVVKSHHKRSDAAKPFES